MNFANQILYFIWFARINLLEFANRMAQRKSEESGLLLDHDPKGHLTEESHLDKDGKIVKEEKFQYQGSLLQSKQDSMGLFTTYKYDGTGLKIKVSNVQLYRLTIDSTF